MANRIYIIHGDNPKDCIDLMKENNLDRHKCVFVLRGFEGGKEKDTAEYKHIWRRKAPEYVRCKYCGNNMVPGKKCAYCSQ